MDKNLLAEYKELLKEWKKFSNFRDDTHHIIIKNNTRFHKSEFRVWYLEWVRETLLKKLKEIDPKGEFSTWPMTDKEDSNV